MQKVQVNTVRFSAYLLRKQQKLVTVFNFKLILVWRGVSEYQTLLSICEQITLRNLINDSVVSQIQMFWGDNVSTLTLL